MYHQITYGSYSGTNRLEQNELQRLAKNILDNGEVISINHFTFATNKYTANGDMQSFRDGGKSIEVKGFGFTYYIHFSGLKVTTIIETYEQNENVLLVR